MKKDRVEIKIFGSGCMRCEKLADECREVAQELNVAVSIEKVTDQDEIINEGVLFTPGLMINGKLMSSGKIPVKNTLKNWVQNATK